jgi:hypothetical protein
MAWRGFSADEVAAIRAAIRAADIANPRPGQRLTELTCPHCDVRSLRTYLHTSGTALISQVWCPRCERFTGSTGPIPEGLRFTDPIGEERHAVLGVADLFRELNRLWGLGVLPQTYI